MNPLRWVRWKVVIVLALLCGLLWFIGLDPLARWQINALGEDRSGARWSVTEVGLGLLAGDVQLIDVLVAAARKAQKKAAEINAGSSGEKEKVFNADEVKFALSAGELARRRFVIDEMGLTRPHMELRRRADGSTNVGDLEGSETEWPDAEKIEDWVRSAVDWYKKIQKAREKLPTGDRDAEEERERQKQLDPWQRRVEYPFAGRPTYLVRRIFADELEISFSDEAEAESDIAKLTEGKIEITDLSSNPVAHENPMKLSLSGKLAGSPLSLETAIDFSKDASRYSIHFDAAKLPVSVVDAFVGDALPVQLADGFIGLTVRLDLDGEENLELTPKLIFQGVRVEAKAGASKIAGADAASFVKAFNEASEALGDTPLEIADLTIRGKLTSPRFEWGDTVTNLVQQGGLAFANRQIEQGRERLTKELDKSLEKGLQKATEEIDKALGGAGLEGTGLGDAAKGVLEGVVPKSGSTGEATGATVDKIKGLIPGLGGDKKN